jgi:ABC-type nitrate/sulfonate/bicarbonate transport system substrate-binding protein
MRRKFQYVICLAGAGLLAALAAGCTSVSSSSAPSSLEKTNLTVGAVPVADEVGLYIAKDRGLFAEGLNVTTCTSWRSRPVSRA